MLLERFVPLEGAEIRPWALPVRTAIMPLRGKATRKNLMGLVWGVVHQRRNWLQQLNPCLTAYTGRKLDFRSSCNLLNCRPCGFAVARRTRVCGRRYCPFCWGRMTLAVYQRIKQIRGDGQVVSLLCTLPAYMTQLASCHRDTFVSQSRTLLDTMVQRRQKLQAWALEDATAAGFCITIEPPVMEGPSDVDCSKLHWRPYLRVIAVLPKDWELPLGSLDTSTTRRAYVDPTAKQLANAVVRTLTYPTQYMYGDVQAMAGMLVATYNRNLLSFTGEFRNQGGWVA